MLAENSSFTLNPRILLPDDNVPEEPPRSNEYLLELKAIKQTWLRYQFETGGFKDKNHLSAFDLTSRESLELIRRPSSFGFFLKDNDLEEIDSQPSSSADSSFLNGPRPLKLWKETVSPELYASLSKAEQTRQECIFETIYTELDFINTLKLIRKAILKPAIRAGIFDTKTMELIEFKFFYNYMVILELSEKLYEQLIKIQSKGQVVKDIAPAFIEWAHSLESYAFYGAHLPLAQQFLETEMEASPQFELFISELKYSKSTNFLPIMSFMNAPTTRLARMPLLLKSILDHTPPGTLDSKMLPNIIQLVTKHLIVVDGHHNLSF